MWILLKDSMKVTFLPQSVMVAKGKISFATMTHGCKAVIIDNFWSLLKIRINQWIWQKTGKFHFSFFKVDSQNQKFNLEYLTTLYSIGIRVFHVCQPCQWITCPDAPVPPWPGHWLQKPGGEGTTVENALSGFWKQSSSRYFLKKFLPYL